MIKARVHNCAEKLNDLMRLNIEFFGFQEKVSTIQEAQSPRRALVGQFGCSS